MVNSKNNKRSKKDRSITGNPNKRNKTVTMQLFKDAALEIIRKEGFEQLRVNKLERKVGKSKRLLYDYFGGIEGLLKEILYDTDPWLSYNKHVAQILKLHRNNKGKDLAGILLKNHLVYFSSDKLAQQISLLELTKKGNRVLRDLSNSRERLGDKLFSISNEHFDNTKVDIRFVMALLIGGINYMTLHKETNGSSFCGTDIKNERDFKKLCETLDQISKWAYENAHKELQIG